MIIYVWYYISEHNVFDLQLFVLKYGRYHIKSMIILMQPEFIYELKL